MGGGVARIVSVLGNEGNGTPFFFCVNREVLCSPWIPGPPISASLR